MPVVVDSEPVVNDSSVDGHSSRATATDAVASAPAQNTVMVVAGGEGYIDFRAGRRIF